MIEDAEVSKRGLAGIVDGSIAWGDFIDGQLGELHARGVRWPEVAEMLRSSPMHAGCLRALADLKRRTGATVISLSSGNETFVRTMAEQAGHATLFDHVIAQPTRLDPDGRLHVWMRSPPDRPHGCLNGCYRGMCKGASLESVIDLARYDRIVYAGDGHNDFCTAVRLRGSDLVLARQGFPLDRLLAEREVRCEAKRWRTGDDLAALLDSLQETETLAL